MSSRTTCKIPRGASPAACGPVPQLRQRRHPPGQHAWNQYQRQRRSRQPVSRPRSTTKSSTSTASVTTASASASAEEALPAPSALPVFLGLVSKAHGCREAERYRWHDAYKQRSWHIFLAFATRMMFFFRTGSRHVTVSSHFCLRVLEDIVRCSPQNSLGNCPTWGHRRSLLGTMHVAATIYNHSAWLTGKFHLFIKRQEHRHMGSQIYMGFSDDISDCQRVSPCDFWRVNTPVLNWYHQINYWKV